MIKYLENENMKDIIKEGIYIVDFYADWCGPCKMMGSVLENMSATNILKINTDSHPDVASEYGIMNIPTLLFFKDGEEIKKTVGFKTKEEIQEILDQL